MLVDVICCDVELMQDPSLDHTLLSSGLHYSQLNRSRMGKLTINLRDLIWQEAPFKLLHHRFRYVEDLGTEFTVSFNAQNVKIYIAACGGRGGV